MGSFRFRFATVVVAVVTLIGAGGSAASANVARGDRADYTAQADKLGLSAADAASLQKKVDVLVAKTGGKQVAINKISLEGADILVTLPGERAGRDLAGSAQAGDCTFYYFCVWRSTNWTGDQMRLYTCDLDYNMPWAGNGSYTNAQSAPGIAEFKNSGHGVISTSCRPLCQVASINWTPIYFINPC